MARGQGGRMDSGLAGAEGGHGEGYAERSTAGPKINYILLKEFV